MSENDITYCVPPRARACANTACPKHRTRIDISPGQSFRFADFTAECPEFETEEVLGVQGNFADDSILPEA